MKFSTIFILSSMLLILFQGILHGVKDKEPITFGHYRTLNSKAMGEERTVLIHLPSDYEKSGKKYPVLFKLDASKITFFQSASMVWYLSEMAERIPGHIIVGIQNIDRHKDFNLKGDQFLIFIKDELIPFIESNYRTTDTRILAGQSAGTHPAFRSFLKYPGLFNMYILISFGCPANMKTDFQKDIINSKEIKTLKNTSFFVTNAKNDPYDPSGKYSGFAKMVFDILKQTIPKSNRTFYKIYEDESHVPFPSLYDALKWYYKKRIK